MPQMTRAIEDLGGPIVDLLIGVNNWRRAALERTGFPVPPRARVRAQVDTGSAVTGVSPQVLAGLDLRPVDTMLIRTPSTTGEPHRCNVFAVSLGLADPDIELHLPSVEVIECPFEAEEGIQAMIGRDVLAHCLFVYNGPVKTFAIAF